MENPFNIVTFAENPPDVILARGIVGNRARWELVAMEKALSKLELMNTPEEAERLQACRVLLGKGKLCH